MTGRRIARRLIGMGLAGLIGSASLVLIWGPATATALGLAALVSRAGGSEPGAAAAFGPPLGLVYAIAFRALLRALLRRRDAKQAESAARAEGEALLHDPEFLESLDQLARGELRPARTRDEQENPDG